MLNSSKEKQNGGMEMVWWCIGRNPPLSLTTCVISGLGFHLLSLSKYADNFVFGRVVLRINDDAGKALHT